MPETKFGKCPWCERHNQTLYFAAGSYDGGRLWFGYICGRCLNVARIITGIGEEKDGVSRNETGNKLCSE